MTRSKQTLHVMDPLWINRQGGFFSYPHIKTILSLAVFEGMLVDCELMLIDVNKLPSHINYKQNVNKIIKSYKHFKILTYI